MIKWITSNPLLSAMIAAVLIAAVAAFFAFMDKGNRRHEGQLVNQGVLIERDAGKTEVLNHVEKANNAADRPTDAQRSDLCQKYDRACQEHQ